MNYIFIVAFLSFLSNTAVAVAEGRGRNAEQTRTNAEKKNFIWFLSFIFKT